MKKDVEIVFEPKSETYNPNDDRWIVQVNELVLECQREVGHVHKEISVEEGSKGGFEDLIMVLGSSGVIAAVVDIFKSWISIDRTRSLVLKIKDGEHVVEYEVSGKGLSKDKLNEFMDKALEIHNKE